MARKPEKGGKFRNVHCRTWKSLGREARWSCQLYMLQYRGVPEPRNMSGWVWEQDREGEGIGDFQDSI